MRPGISTFRLQSITSSVEAGLTLRLGRFFRQLFGGRVCQDTSLWVLGDEFQSQSFKNKTHDVHSWLRLACEIIVLEAL